jgi:hypothetical protein
MGVPVVEASSLKAAMKRCVSGPGVPSPMTGGQVFL